jgi:hypothetical protein
METAYTSETSVTPPTSTLGYNPRTESPSVINRQVENLQWRLTWCWWLARADVTPLGFKNMGLRKGCSVPLMPSSIRAPNILFHVSQATATCRDTLSMMATNINKRKMYTFSTCRQKLVRHCIISYRCHIRAFDISRTVNFSTSETRLTS